MKLFIIANNFKRASFRQRIEIYLDILRNNGINCEVALFPRGSWSRWKLLRRCSDFDAVLLHKKTLNFVDAFWLRHYAKKVIFNFDDAIMYYDKQPERKPSRHKHKNPFKRTIKLSSLVIAGNTYLAEHAKKFNSNVEILATGLNTTEYRCQAEEKTDDKIRLVWIGSGSTVKYLAEIRPALEKIGKRFDNVVLRVVCNDFFDLQNMAIEKRPWSLETQYTDLATSDIGLAPLPDDRFTRGKCGFKILQYASVGLPVIASPVGVNTDLVKSNVNGFVAGDINQWVEGISNLIENPQLIKQMGQKNLEMVKDYDIDAIGKRFIKLLKQSINNV
jgi:glycosyltransferase involved in cell wall biosynthesis